LKKEGKEGEGKCKWTSGSTNRKRFDCRYQVVCMVSSLVLACMVYACGFPSSLDFLDSHGVLGLFPLIIFLLALMIHLAMG